jgi:eukaryotic-like serine/threonine-protein kinase
MSPSAGDRLGPYELLAPIGAGGMGEVWKAKDTRVGRMVAIKRLTGQNVKRFQQEARTIAALNHPHICQLYDVGPDYLVMELVRGSTLRRPMPADEAVKLAIQIASALEAAHRKGIVHRDLKPANVMVTEAGVKLLDFGLAKREELPANGSLSTISAALTEPGVVVGTVAYMSPEQAQGLPVDARSDIFSFGVLLYEMLCGTRPFLRATALATLSAIVHDEPPAIETRAALVQIVMHCLAKDPARRYQMMGEVRAALERAARPPADERPSIAVLPFVNMSREGDDEYFSDGLAEEISNELGHAPGLKVIARTSAFAFKGQNLDIRRIADALGVTNLLEGSVRRDGNRLRVTAHLIAAADGTRVWSERYERELTGVFAIQDEIAAAIAGALQVRLSAERAAPRHPRLNLAAYEAYLKARFHLAKVTPESLARARHCLEEAISLDPAYDLAHGELAHYFIAQAVYGHELSAHEAIPSARAAARRALAINPSLPEAHAALGAVAALYDYDWREAGRQFRLAMARDPVPPYVRFHYGLYYLLPTGRPAEAVTELERGLEEDPLNLIGRTYRALCLQAAGRSADSVAELYRVLELDENFWFPHFLLGMNHAMAGAVADALRFAERAYTLAPWSTVAIGLLAGVSSCSGDSRRAEQLIAKLEPGDAFGAPHGLAHYFLLRSDVEAAAKWFEKAIEERHPAVLFFQRTYGTALASSPRWPALAKMMHLPGTA